MITVTSASSSKLITSRAYGRRVGIAISDGAEDAVREVLPFWWHDEDIDPEHVAEVADPKSAERVVRDLELWVAEHAIDVLFVHAGVVEIDGRAVLIPGRSFSGKTTLVHSLIASGAGYLSDEYAVLGPDGLVQAYSRPLSIRKADGSRPQVPASETGAETVDEPLPVGLIAVIKYEPGADWSVEPLSPANAMLALLDNTVAAQTRHDDALGIFQKVVSVARAVRGTRGESSVSDLGRLRGEVR